MKRHFTSDRFFKLKGIWELTIWLSSGLIYVGFEEFFHNAENVTRFILLGELTRTTKLFQNELRLANPSS